MNLFGQFKAFVCKQTEDREINHGSWCRCAVGEFVKETEGEKGELLKYLEQHHFYIYESLNNGRPPIKEENIRTFGALCEFLDLHEGESERDYGEVDEYGNAWMYEEDFDDGRDPKLNAT